MSHVELCFLGFDVVFHVNESVKAEIEGWDNAFIGVPAGIVYCFSISFF